MDYALELEISLYLLSLLIPMYPPLGLMLNIEQVNGCTGICWVISSDQGEFLHLSIIAMGCFSFTWTVTCGLGKQS